VRSPSQRWKLRFTAKTWRKKILYAQLASTNGNGRHSTVKPGKTEFYHTSQTLCSLRVTENENPN